MRVVALDIVRFAAALSVVLYHYISDPGSDFPDWLQAITDQGYLGVQLFFMISGFVIADSASRKSPADFAVARFVRLYPTLWVCILLTVSVSYLVSGWTPPLAQILANFTLLQDYLGQDHVDGVYWTLVQELKFYACTFLLMLAGVFHRHRVWLPLWLLMTACFTFFQQPFFMGWFISPAYSAFFIAGLACYFIRAEGGGRFNVAILIASLPLALINSYDVAGNFIPGDPGEGPKIASLCLIVLFYGLMYGLATGHLKAKARPGYLLLGALTYPLYLLHNVIGKQLIFELKQEVTEGLAVLIVTVGVVFLSWLLHRFIEKPLNKTTKAVIEGTLNRLSITR